MRAIAAAGQPPPMPADIGSVVKANLRCALSARCRCLPAEAAADALAPAPSAATWATASAITGPDTLRIQDTGGDETAVASLRPHHRRSNGLHRPGFAMVNWLI